MLTMYQYLKQRPDLSLCYCHDCISKQLSCSTHGEQFGPNKDWGLEEYIGSSSEEQNIFGRHFENKNLKIIEWIDQIWRQG